MSTYLTPLYVFLLCVWQVHIIMELACPEAGVSVPEFTLPKGRLRSYRSAWAKQPGGR
jgi:hypothetical protein